VDAVLMSLFSGGNVLLEGVPGLGKTLLVRSLAQTLSLPFNRIQFTPDLMPADVIGTNIVMEDPDTGRRKFEFQRGPIFAQVVLADEINRATPKTQSALLEAMQERSVTVAGVSYKLDKPFIVLATQNPIEYEGTFPLPEAQLDRFLMRVSIGYPSRAQQVAILDAQQFAHPLDSLTQVTDADELLRVYQQIKSVHADMLVKEYIVALVDATRKHPDVYLGASPRGALTLFRTAQVRAALHGRDYVIPDDVKALAPAALGHRVILAPSARIKGVQASDVLAELLADTPVPGAAVKGR
jgi:MoxR-like ATPase